jgi:hypothetical protein
MFESGSEREWLLLIQTLISYNLNPAILRTFTVPVANMSVTAAKPVVIEAKNENAHTLLLFEA